MVLDGVVWSTKFVKRRICIFCVDFKLKQIAEKVFFELKLSLNGCCFEFHVNVSLYGFVCQQSSISAWSVVLFLYGLCILHPTPY